jgi:hypothetical protein
MTIYAHIKTCKLFQICKQVVTRLLSSRYQDVFALLVLSCCDKSGTSCYHLVTRLMTVIDLLQVVATRLIHAVRNKLLRACCHQLVNNLLRADDIRLVDKQFVASLLASSTLLQNETCQQLGTSSANRSCWQAVRFLRVFLTPQYLYSLEYFTKSCCLARCFSNLWRDGDTIRRHVCPFDLRWYDCSLDWIFFVRVKKLSRRL